MLCLIHDHKSKATTCLDAPIKPKFLWRTGISCIKCVWWHFRFKNCVCWVRNVPLLFNNSNLIRHNSHFSGTRWWNATDRSSFSLFHSFIFFPFVSIVFFTSSSSSSPFSASKKQNNNSMIFQTRSSRHLVGHNRPFPVQLQTVFPFYFFHCSWFKLAWLVG